MAVTDIRDLRVLIPAARRSIDGPEATGSASVSATLTDDMVLAAVADATAELILMVGPHAFGYTLEVTERDTDYMAPVEWATDKERSPQVDAVIVSQAALNYHFRRLTELKTSETIKDEGEEWTYSISANALATWLKLLTETRDRALDMLITLGAPLDTYVSTVTARDVATARLVEPWVEGVSGIGGQGPNAYLGLLSP